MKKPLESLGLLIIVVCQCAGCVIFSSYETQTVEQIPGVAVLESDRDQVSLVAAKEGSFGEMKIKGEPVEKATLRVGETVNLPIMNGRADYRLESCESGVVQFATKEFFCTCGGPLYVHRSGRVRVSPYRIEMSTTRPTP